MTLAHPFRTLASLLAAAGLIIVPLANPLLLSFCLILAGVLTAWRGAAEIGSLVSTESVGRDVVFRHYL